MTREEFTEYYCRNMTKEDMVQLLATNIVMPCDCDYYTGCEGWQMATVHKMFLPRIKQLIETAR